MLDLIGTMTQTDEMTFVDHKFTGWLSDGKPSEWRMSGQFPLYAYAMEKMYGTPVRNAFVNAVEWSRLPGGANSKTPKKRCWKHGVPYVECRMLHAKSFVTHIRFTEDIIGEVVRSCSQGVEKLLALERHHLPVERAKEVPANGRLSGACIWCEYKTLCLYGCTEQAIKTLLHKDERYVEKEGA